MRRLLLLLPFTVACAQEIQIGSRRAALANPTPPESPALVRDVHLVESGAFTRPAIPPLRTTLDGRLAIDLKKWNPASVGLYLFAPEKLATSPASARACLRTRSPAPVSPSSSICAASPCKRRG